MNLFRERPELKDFRQPVVWTDPYSGLAVPKDPTKNLVWRADILELAETDRELQTDLYTACSQSLLFFVNAFAFTLRVFEPGDEGANKQAKNAHLPFVTWPIQDEMLLKLENALDVGEELLTDKSRDMGATWIHIVTYVHRFLFKQDEMHLMVSRKEDAVDVLDGLVKNYPYATLADPGTLFGKIDYVLSRLPEWMLPRMTRKKMHLVNLDTRCRIDGESANASAGSSDRRTSIFLDEMAKMDEAESIKRSTKDVTACRLVCSTPNGAGTTYSKWRMSGHIPVFILPWWEHPEKGRAKYLQQDRLGRWKIRSPWYDHECETRTPKEVAVEIDMDHIGSGDTFFESTSIEEHKKLFGKMARLHVAFTWRKELTDEKIVQAIRAADKAKIVKSPKGPWQIWALLNADGRLDQTKTYVMGVDIGKGQGASNSTVSVTCSETREKVMSFASAEYPPYEFAKLVTAAAVWVWGKNKRPLVIFENNGDPGFDFGRQLVHVYHWPNLYFDKKVGTLNEKAGKRYGWRSNPEKKAEALGMLRRAYAHGRFINHDVEALNEALAYVHYDGGGIGPAEMVMESDAVRKAHGDRVIADMLCVWAMLDFHKVKDAAGATPQRTFGKRMEVFKQAKKDAKKPFPSRFDFSGSN